MKLLSSLTRRELIKLPAAWLAVLAASDRGNSFGRILGTSGPLLVSNPVEQSAKAAPPPANQDSSQFIFSDITDEAGITWRHFNGESPDRLLIETFCGSAAFFDFDGDGLLDIYFVNGGDTPKGKSKTPVRNALYRNLGNGKFEDVAAKAGLDRIPFYGMGVAAADYDNDGFPDLYITGFPSCALFHNNRDGTFTDVTEKAGVQNPGMMAASAAWFDYDRDGLLDLFVCNYTRLDVAHPPACMMGSLRGYCDPELYAGEPPVLYHNNGNGTFTNVTAKAGLQKFVGRALGVVSLDINDDGWQDLLVVRDRDPNLLLINKGNGTFENHALDAEVAYNSDGMARSGMGVDAGDVNEDGRPDFVITNFNDEYHALYLNPGSFPYEDWTFKSGLSKFTRLYVGWGTKFIDYDNNGILDLMIVNGHVNKTIEIASADLTYKEPPLLLRNNGKAILENMRETAGPVFKTRYPARGLAVGDFDNDGDTDAVFVCLNQKPVLLRNNVGHQNHWIGFQLVGTKSNRDAIGAKLTLTLGNRSLVRWLKGGSSYLSSHDKRVTFGLGEKTPDALSLEIKWPSGSLQKVSGLKPDHYHKIREA